MSLNVEDATLHDPEPELTGPVERSVALIGPNDASRRVMAKALAGSEAATVREYVAYPSRLTDLPRILEQNYDLVMVDVDSDESYALAIVEKIAVLGTATVMVYSTRNQPDLIMRCMQAGARDFLPIPEEAAPPPPPAEAAPAPRVDASVAEDKRTAWPQVDRRAPKTLSVPIPGPLREPPALPPLSTPEPPIAAVPPDSAFRPVNPVVVEPYAKRSGALKWVLVFIALLLASAGAGVVYMRNARPTAAAIAPPPTVAVSQPADPVAASATTAPASSAVEQAGQPQPSPLQRSEPSGAASAPAVESAAMDAQLAAPSRISKDMKKPAPREEPTPGFTPGGMESGAAVPGAAFSSRGSVRVVPAVSAISAGVAAGMLIHRTEPVYPPFARTAHISGTVVLGATITKTGALENLHALSGPTILVNAALTAAQTWRYRPYLLDGQPIEVQTTIRVVFNLGN